VTSTQHKEVTEFIQQDLDRGKLLGQTVETNQSLRASLKQSKEYSVLVFTPDG
jgi:hypothetical protein